MSDDAVEFISKLLASQNERVRTIEEAKVISYVYLCYIHITIMLFDTQTFAFFRDTNWKGIRRETAPFVPEFTSPMDTYVVLFGRSLSCIDTHCSF